MADRFDVSEVLLRLDDDEFGLSSGEESDFAGDEVHGYLPVAAEILASVTSSPSAALSDSACESDSDADAELSAEMVQGRNKRCSSAQLYPTYVSIVDGDSTIVEAQAEDVTSSNSVNNDWQ